MNISMYLLIVVSILLILAITKIGNLKEEIIREKLISYSWKEQAIKWTPRTDDDGRFIELEEDAVERFRLEYRCEMLKKHEIK